MSAAYLEVNVHTGERTLHTLESLTARLIALDLFKNGVTLPIHGKHSWFRVSHDTAATQTARSNGLPPSAIRRYTWVTCNTCNGVGSLLLAPDEPTVTCWGCNGTRIMRKAA